VDGTGQVPDGLHWSWSEVRKQDEDTRTEEQADDFLKDLEAAEKIIVQFDDIDGKPEVFRYPKDKNGKITLPRMQIDIVKLKEALGWLRQFLDGWSAGIYEYKQAPSD